jgi:hypothetical protein
MSTVLLVEDELLVRELAAEDLGMPGSRSRRERR